VLESAGVLEWWSAGVLEWWSAGVLEGAGVFWRMTKPKITNDMLSLSPSCLRMPVQDFAQLPQNDCMGFTLIYINSY
jgi:hypothetical protein